jgi:RNA polymerase sigma-70 factor (ECF subfamily)
MSKEVIILREFQGFSYEEMANILEISIGTVKSRLSRARENLRQDLKKLVTGVKNNEA